MNPIPFSQPHITPSSTRYLAECLKSGILQGCGPFSKRCESWIENKTGAHKVLLTSSCTDALEMCAILLDLKEGDEVIMPSYTFTSSATAFVLRGAIPVFVDIRKDTINIDESLIETAITPKTKAILIVHYGGVACDLDSIIDIAQRHNIALIEDAAHAYGATYKGKALGSFGKLGTYSFHNSKNISSGEGGALLINDPSMVHRAEIIHEKGTDRSHFMRGDVAFYTWQDIGSSFLMSDMTASFLLGQLEAAEEINERRIQIWKQYHEAFDTLEKTGFLKRPSLPGDSQHNAHLYYILLNSRIEKERMLSEAKKESIAIISHYVSLHSAPAGHKFGRIGSTMNVTNDVSDCLVRLPLFADMTSEQTKKVIEFVTSMAGNI